MYLRLMLLCVFMAKVHTKCEKTFTYECEKVKDVEIHGLKSWESLIISQNKCNKTTSHTLDEVLTRDAFNKTPNIQELIIVEKVNAIEVGAFNGVKRFDLLKFYKNQLTVLPRLAFADLHIYKLDLSHNSIQNIVPELFRRSTVTVLNLSHNKLSTITLNILNLPSLRYLTLSNNNLQSLADECFHENLEHLNLGSNGITQIEEGVIAPLKNLKELNLSNNRLKGVKIAYGMPKLETLDLSHNEIDQIAEGSFGQFLKLKHLLLNHNYLTSISPTIFPDPNSIVTLNLHSNAFMYITEETTKVLRKVREITTYGNPWACSCLKRFYDFLQEYNITQPECEQKFYAEGNTAVCVITTDTCMYNDKLTQEHFQSFRVSPKKEFCG
uniref:LRRCT domain-containing protein n=1 Tax=Photinus pyralis TaxID=7054 RepID=A0A1Y1M5D7_PHOPY